MKTKLNRICVLITGLFFPSLRKNICNKRVLPWFHGIIEGKMNSPSVAKRLITKSFATLIALIKKFIKITEIQILILLCTLFFSSYVFADNNEQLLKLLPNLNQQNQAFKTQSNLPYPATNFSIVDHKTTTQMSSVQPLSPRLHQTTIPKNTSASTQATAITSASTSSDLTINSSQNSTRLWNLNNIDIRDVIQEISKETGKNFIVDPRVQGKITIVSSTPMDAAGIYQVFLSTLQVLGYSAIPSGHIIKIIPDAESNQGATTVASRLQPGTGDEAVVRVLPVRNVNAEQLVPVLRPLLPQSATISANQTSNTLIIAGRANNVERIAEIVHKVDTINVNGIDVIPLNYALAQDVVNSLQQLLSSSKNPFIGGANAQVSISVDDRSNSVLLSGNQSERLKLKVLISQLDTPNGQNGNTQVIYLHYLKAPDLVPILAGIAQSYYRGPVGTVIGTRTQSGVDYASINNPQSNDISSNTSSTNTSPNYGSYSAPGTATPSYPNPMLTTGSFGQSSSGLGGSNITNTDTNAPKPKVEIIAEPNTNAIILNAPPTLLRTLQGVIAKLDVRPAQILVEALIAEVDRSTSAQLGIQWGAFTQPGQTGIGTNDLVAGFRAGIGIVTGQGIHNLQGIVTAIGQAQDSNILSTPAVVVLDNHQAKIEVGQEVSIQNSEYPNNAGGTTSASPFTTFDREKVALHLYVTPQIDQGKTLMLSIDQGNDTLQDPENINPQPVVNISSIKTSVLVNSGDILVLGGLTQNQLTRGNTGVPLLKDIPGIGNLFKVNNHSKNKKELLVFIRPIILYDQTQGLQITSNKYNQIRNNQLNWFKNDYHYPYDYKDYMLPHYKKPPQLPKPFP